MRIVVIGRGKMGNLIKTTAEAAGHEIVGLYDIENKDEVLGEPCDVIMDFSHRDNLQWVSDYAKDKGAAIVYGTTGLTDEHKALLAETAKSVPVFFASNFSLGVAVLKKAVETVAPALKDTFDIEVIEIHHNQKADAPSGTAKTLVEAIDPDNEFEKVYGREGMTGKRKKEIGVHAIRGGSVAGEHQVLFLGKDEEVIFKHKAISRQIFVNGALKAAEFTVGKEPGMYGMEDLL